jgi:hypothetical protein
MKILAPHGTNLSFFSLLSLSGHDMILYIGFILIPKLIQWLEFKTATDPKETN